MSNISIIVRLLLMKQGRRVLWIKLKNWRQRKINSLNIPNTLLGYPIVFIEGLADQEIDIIGPVIEDDFRA